MTYCAFCIHLTVASDDAEYWLGLLIALSGAAVTIWTYISLAGWEVPQPSAQTMIAAVALALSAVFPGISFAVRRLHDRDKSGFWLLLFWVVPAGIEWLRLTSLHDGFFSFILGPFSTGARPVFVISSCRQVVAHFDLFSAARLERAQIERVAPVLVDYDSFITAASRRSGNRPVPCNCSARCTRQRCLGHPSDWSARLRGRCRPSRRRPRRHRCTACRRARK